MPVLIDMLNAVQIQVFEYSPVRSVVEKLKEIEKNLIYKHTQLAKKMNHPIFNIIN